MKTKLGLNLELKFKNFPAIKLGNSLVRIQNIKTIYLNIIKLID